MYVLRGFPDELKQAVYREATFRGIAPRAYILDAIRVCTESDQLTREDHARWLAAQPKVPA